MAKCGSHPGDVQKTSHMTKKPDNASDNLLISPADMEAEFFRILIRHGFTEARAKACAEVFTLNSVDGVYTHGVNRFPRFIEYIRNKLVFVDAEPECVSAFGGLEQWKGNLGPGPLNAMVATDRCIELAGKYGLGCVALADTNHWMRGGLYGWRAAKAGCVFIGWTNTIANMPAWGASDVKLGNNPLVIAIPYQQDAIVLDMAMSQYSYGALELHKLKQNQLAVDGGYDESGNLTKDPQKILNSKRVLPIGYWKGAGLSLLLDILATVLSAGNSTSEITSKGTEFAVSQVFIAIDLAKLHNNAGITAAIDQIINDYHQSQPASPGNNISYPGERVLRTRMENIQAGIPVASVVWEEITAL